LYLKEQPLVSPADYAAAPRKNESDSRGEEMGGVRALSASVAEFHTKPERRGFLLEGNLSKYCFPNPGARPRPSLPVVSATEALPARSAY